ncbi:AAA family ATPase [Mycobacterium lehmannii]|uniref:AAA family ATPase n=1 Tax=Mycobacterium lehmannii TaxID=2048550 RepID=UPI000B9459E6|nr:AAA family ATPase [Mycobacterium lehmannii]
MTENTSPTGNRADTADELLASMPADFLKASAPAGRGATNGSEPDTDDDDLALAVPARIAAEVLCKDKLTQRVRRALGQQTLYVNVDDLVTLGLMTDGQRPTIEEADGACHRILRSGLDLYGRAMPLDTLRGIVSGYDPSRPIALATLAGVAERGHEYAALAVKKLRDRNTVGRAEGRRAGLALSLTVAELLELGATDTDARALPTADEGSRAASVRIIEGWNEADRTEARRPTQPAAAITLTKASKVMRRHADWLWTTEGMDPYQCGVTAAMIPLHGLTTIAGREQAAKSTFCWWLAAQVTHGLLPGHYEGQPRDVVIMASEDSESKIRRRLEAAGADLDRVYLPTKTTADGIVLPISIRDDLDTITNLLTEIEPGLVIFDPIKDFLGDGINTDREDEVRPVLTPLLKLTEECGTAVVGLHHLNKSLKGDFLTRLTGSGAFKNVSRSVIGIAHELSTDRRLVQLMKSNDGELARAAFQARVIGVDITIDGRTEKVGKWIMDGVSLSDLDTVLAAKEQGGRGGSAVERAKDALAKYLGDAQKPSDEVRQAVASQLNVSEETVKRAFRELGGQSTRTKEKPSRTLWSLPDAADDADGDQGD